MGPTWSLPGANRTQVGPMLAPWTLLSRHIDKMIVSPNNSSNNCVPQKINVDVKGLDIIYMCKLIIFANIWISNKIKPCVYCVAHHPLHYVIWLLLWSGYKHSKHPWGYFRNLIWLSGHEINCGSINSFRSQSKFSLPGPRLYQQTLLSVIYVWILFGSMMLLKPILNHQLRDLLQQYLVWSLQYFRFVYSWKYTETMAFMNMQTPCCSEKL